MSREESLVSVLVSAEALLRAANYPACRGLPTVTVPIGMLDQVAGAVASVVAVPEAPYPVVDADRPGFCSNPECHDTPLVPGGTCYAHSAIAQKAYPWELRGLRRRDALFEGVGDG